MIYNFVNYLRVKFPDELFYANSIDLITGQDEIPDRKVLVKETGGPIQMKTGFTEQTVQIVSFAIDQVVARALTFSIFCDIHDRNGLLLPVVTVNGEIFAEVETGCIKAIQLPYPMGPDQSGVFVWTTNYLVKYVR